MVRWCGCTQQLTAANVETFTCPFFNCSQTKPCHSRSRPDHRANPNPPNLKTNKIDSAYTAAGGDSFGYLSAPRLIELRDTKLQAQTAPEEELLCGTNHDAVRTLQQRQHIPLSSQWEHAAPIELLAPQETSTSTSPSPIAYPQLTETLEPNGIKSLEP
jgi:hypothetical protein